MKSTLSAIALLFTLCTLAQNTPQFTVTLKGWHRDGRQLPAQFDTVYLETRPKQTVQIFQQVTAADSFFQLPSIPTGKYWLRFANAQYCVAPLPIVVCSKCDNTFEFFSFLRTPQDDCNAFTMVEMSAGYTGGNKALSKDFQQALSKKEWKSVKASAPFTIHFFITKQNAISDVSIIPTTLSEEVKQTIIKGLNRLTQWNPAVQNGRIVDAEYTMDQQTLFEH